MTNATDSNSKGVGRSWRKPRTAHTVLLRQLMEQQQRKEMGQRIAELRERSPWTQEQVGERLGYKTPRGYQKLEENGTTKFELCEKLASIHREWTQRSAEWQHVTADWVWDGSCPDNATGDLLEGLREIESLNQLDRLEQKLDRLLAWAEKRTVQEVEAEFGLGEGQEPRPEEETGD